MIRTETLTLLFVPLFALLIAPQASAQDALTYPDLVQRLIDLERLAVLPVAGETCRQWSSWDRSSQYDAATGKYVRWARTNWRRATTR